MYVLDCSALDQEEFIEKLLEYAGNKRELMAMQSNTSLRTNMFSRHDIYVGLMT
jgi:hypothetical protein